MKNEKKLAEVKSLLQNKNIYETQTGFLVNEFGKYQPNITFVISKKNERNPLEYRNDMLVSEMLANMNLNFNGKSAVIFGDFWKSQKGGACFRPKSISEAWHVLIRTNWGGAFESSRGIYNAPQGALHFRRASSNGGGSGYDYIVVPLGYYSALSDEGEILSSSHQEKSFLDKAKAIRKRFIEHDAQVLREKEESERLSREAKAAGLGTRLEVVNTKFVSLGENYSIVELGETFFKYGYTKYFYTEKNVSWIENYFSSENKKKEEEKIQKKLREEFQPKFEVFVPRLDAIGLSLSFFTERVCFSGESGDFSFSEEGLVKFLRSLEEKEQRFAESKIKADAEAQYQRRKNEAVQKGLPKDIHIWCRRGGRTNAGDGWVIGPNGEDRPNTSWINPRPRYTQEGSKVWDQILHGEIVLKWSKSHTAGGHVFEVIHLPEEGLTEAQLERIIEIQDELEADWEGACGLASGIPSPSVGDGWGLNKKEIFETLEEEKSDGDVTLEDLKKLQEKFENNS